MPVFMLFMVRDVRDLSFERLQVTELRLIILGILSLGRLGSLCHLTATLPRCPTLQLYSSGPIPS